MKTSIEWLKEYTDINVSLTELSDVMTMTGSKVEGFEQIGNEIKNVVVGKILEIEKHPDADKLVVCKIDVKKEILQIVTGAKNIKVGDIIPVATDGAELAEGLKIKKGKLRGVDSCGMLCSIGELGLNKEDYKDQIEEGIMILKPELESKLGEDIVEVLNLREDIMEFEITSNRPDCLSIEGLGREVAISLKEEYKNPRANLDEVKVEDKNEIEGLKVNIEATDLCYRYIARVVKNVKIGESPDWMKKRLKSAGIRSINNIVDITNYVMLELGQPLHAFDINSIDGKQIIVRRAVNGEKITTLDEIERELDENDLVISDGKKPVAIAGVMGGINSGIEENTNTLVFESAMFYRGTVRKTAKKVGLRTESSARFEKGLSPENSLRAINRAVELVEELKIGEVVEGKIDVYPTKQTYNKIEFDSKRINKLLGTNISEPDMIDTLSKLDIKVEGNIATSPYFRIDLECIEDLAEEVVRIYGYDKLDSSLMRSETTIGTRNKEQRISRSIKNILANAGFSEIYTYGFVSQKDLEKSNIVEDVRKHAITIMNPLSDEYKYMRPTTIPSMMQIVSLNINKKNEDVKLFDLSRNYKNMNSEIENGKLPVQEDILTIGMYGNSEDFFTLKGILENILTIIGVAKFDIEKEVENNTYHTGRCANLKVGIDRIATFGEVHPEVLQNYDISRRVYIAEVNVSKLIRYAKEAKKYTEIPKYPAATRDLAIVVDESVEVGNIEKLIIKKAKKQLETIKIFDIYRSEKLGENKKSIAYNLVFRDKNKTMGDEEVNKIMEDIINELQKTFSAEIRGIK